MAAMDETIAKGEVAENAPESLEIDISLFPPAGSLRRQRLRNTADEFDYRRAAETLESNIPAGSELLRRQIDELMAMDRHSRA